MNPLKTSGDNLINITVTAEQLQLLNLLHGPQAEEIKESLDTTLDTAIFHSTEAITEDLKYGMWKVKNLMKLIGLCVDSPPVKLN